MSMNLGCLNKRTKTEIRLCQLPTKVSYEVWDNGRGGFNGVFKRYKEYLVNQVQSQRISEYRKKEEMAVIDAHLINIKNQVQKSEDFEFYVS